MKNNNELEFELEFALAAKLVAEKKEFSKSLATRLEDFLSNADRDVFDNSLSIARQAKNIKDLKLMIENENTKK